MPRNPQGLYTLPLPPVVPGELIEANWANPTLDDIASALTGSLPRDGTAPMLAPLTLSNIPPTQPRHAVDVGYVQQFLAYATGMPVGAVIPIAGSTIPGGFLLCDGRAVSRTDYATLFAAIGTIYGVGDGATTFNVPDMRGWFVRGRDDSRPIGSVQAASFASHLHPLNDPGHTHTQLAHDHTLTTQAHNHSVTDPGHYHTVPAGDLTLGPNWGLHPSQTLSGPVSTNTSKSYVSVDYAAGLSGTTDSRTPTIMGNTTGVSIGVAGGDETRPQNIAMNYVIKAENDAANTAAIAGVTSSNDSLISIDSSNPVVPQITPHANVAFGMVQLDANAKVSAAQLPAGVQSFLGTFDASGGQNPSQKYPETTFHDGDTYLLSAGGTILVFDPNTNTQAATDVDLGWNLIYLQNQTQPVGWYYLEAPVVTAAIASQVAFTPSGTIGATNVQAAIEELDTETQAGLATKTSAGSAQPTMNGVATPGVSAAASRQDHVHPVDTSRAPASAATAAGTSFTPGGGISSATVQGAVTELDNAKAPKTNPVFTGLSVISVPDNSDALVVYNDYASASDLTISTSPSPHINVAANRGRLTLSTPTQLVFSAGSGVVANSDFTLDNVSTIWNSSSGQVWQAYAETGTGHFVIFGVNNPGSGAYLPGSGGNWVALSDGRYKENLVPIGNALAKVAAINGYIGNFKGQTVRKPFVIAQDVQAVIPEAVDTSRKEQLSMDYADLVPLLVEAIKELKNEVDSLRSQLSSSLRLDSGANQ